jgi:large subunit ribosomal protein L18
MAKHFSKNIKRQAVHSRIRKRIHGTTDRPRLNVYRSLTHIYVQIIDDQKGVTLASASTVDKAIRAQNKTGGNITSAKIVGAEIAKRAKSLGIETVVYDRGGYNYHGRVKALAEAAREAGLKF